jgi:very-short-patch-repair endonuclease
MLGHIIGGRWCPYCVNKTEGKLYEKLKILYPSIISQFKTEWCKNVNNNKLPFDFCIPELNIIIELDGAQHFKQVSNWKSPEQQFENDKYKQECANANHYSMIRLLQEDAWFDKYDWIKELCDAIEHIRSSGGETVTNKYLCKNGEYDHYDTTNLPFVPHWK